ncbi:MAG: hydratase [Candidatus Dormibacteraeota bacterium]|uniref:Hydratase n=1 Tax=Candidatus Amunia macphersoniae TaxID=3127014 RepID=A0A934NGT6_9BACT|nr:hydratase [Candidatus Dormibacteraeota bacterium]
MSRQVRIAVAQYAPHVGDVVGNRAAAVRWAQRAAAEGVDLLVLPELASSGYVFESDEEAARTAEDASTGEIVTALADVCAGSATHCVVGINERSGRVRHNSAVLIGPHGPLATYRKLHLFNDEQSWFEPGGELPAVDLPFGRVGMVICFDLWFPEAVRALALAGAEIIAVPTNWVASFRRQVYDAAGYCVGDIVAMASAAQNGVVMACADRIGVEREVRFLGCSVIVGGDGWPVAGPAGPDEEAFLVAEVDLDVVAATKRRTPRNHLIEDRRPDSYNAVVIPAPRPSSAVPTPTAP